jgi:hypothetical protein
MDRKAGIILSIIFLCAQVMAMLHMAAYGFVKHEHNGHVCGIYICSQQSKDITTSINAVFEHRFDVIQHLKSFPTQTLITFQSYSSYSPRAPPIFLIS